ncbi:hypothetical protein Avbf_15402 [Armadillidium vulgare]|nr:hypothetical protein Avbf_15402 [Armadillidium vulgare]
MDLKGAEKEFESEEKMFFKIISESKYPKVAVGKLSEKEIKECINLREKIIPSKNLEEKDLEIELGSELEIFYKKISESSYPKIVLTKLSEKELKIAELRRRRTIPRHVVAVRKVGVNNVEMRDDDLLLTVDPVRG